MTRRSWLDGNGCWGDSSTSYPGMSLNLESVPLVLLHDVAKQLRHKPLRRRTRLARRHRSLHARGLRRGGRHLPPPSDHIIAIYRVTTQPGGMPLNGSRTKRNISGGAHGAALRAWRLLLPSTSHFIKRWRAGKW